MDNELQSFLSNLKEEFNKSIKSVGVENIKKAAEIILQSEKEGGRVHVTGIGKPGHVAGYIASLLSSTGTSTYELHGTEAVHGSSGQVKKGDVVIAISNSGETLELKATVETLIANGAHIISCTGNIASWLAKHSEVCLPAHVNKEGDNLNKPPRASILSEILILQCLSIVLQNEKKLDLKQYVKWHPGGSLGKSIKEMNRR
ncbi:MAG: SIS domain-containing protein [Clostridium sp.]|jgi:arabinose-5-phosphate isomerase|uniref:SIS domain-containing protein n=1 Tax=Clostridium sp. TaxID=1506 RepID=UPI0025C36AE8|nr:SIS domain-containing protein [Clostridium sp.]MCH3963304.1 SIS domain-containing protein [Clostridium sp.]MCI1717255.1 SIS domain-containing protein [Clostridium sp.]MCI1801595.1 SIS domain-containing protein [Clostridium sp.]MCI1815441.1 SIS domain-containing protein [Clostridium sp.]MCI1872344.1 SIS domain-containing protein [Clostridium sp.]